MRRLLVLAAASSLGACNSGVFGVAASGDDGSNAPTTLSAFFLEGAEQSPATIRFRLSDPESDAAQVELRYRVAGGPERPLTQLGGAGNPAFLSTSATGIEHSFAWEFPAEADLPSDGGLVPNVEVYAVLEQSGVLLPGADIVVGGNAAATSLGNDAPQVLALEVPQQEDDGVVPIPFRVSDSSGNPASVRVEFDIVDAVEEWTLARPAATDSTPQLAIQDLATTVEGVEGIFFWDTAFDLPALEVDVRLRFTPQDAFDQGAPELSSPFRVDNNAEPIAFVDELIFSENTDRVRGISIPMTLFDEESDELLVVPQYRATTESFPTLPCTPCTRAEIEALLADPEQRAAYNLGRAFPRTAEGRLVPASADEVRLPELDNSQSWVAPELVGRTLELHRLGTRVRPLQWAPAALNQAVAALPLGDGTRALVLDGEGGGWRLCEFELARGTLLAELASGLGTPTALALDRSERFAFVASLAGDWSVSRFDLSAGGAQAAGTIAGSSGDGEGVRGLGAFSAGLALASAGDALLELSFAGSAPSSHTVAQGLARPWGVAVDRLQGERAYVGLADANALMSYDRATGQLQPLAPLSTGSFLVGPRALSMSADARDLYVVAQDAGAPIVWGLNLNATLDSGAGSQGSLVHYRVSAQQVDLQGGLGAGADGVLLHALPQTGGLGAGGGLQQRREIVAYDPPTRTVRVEPAFDPAPVAGQPWSVAVSRSVFPSSPQGVPSGFLWDSRDAEGISNVNLRMLTFDSEQGTGTATSDPHALASELVGGHSTTAPGSSGFGLSVIDCADVDGDGDLDLLTSNPDSGSLQIALQLSPGAFDPAPLVLAKYGVTDGAQACRLADVDGDGRVDVVAVLQQGEELAVFFQEEDLSFAPLPLSLPLGEPNSSTEQLVVVADLDRDGKVELVCSTPTSEVVVYEQTAPRAYQEAQRWPLADIQGLCTADLDSDGRMDIGIMTGSEASVLVRVHVWSQALDGSFAQSAEAAHEDSGFLVDGGLRATDVDEDGRTDLLVATGQDNRLVVFFQADEGGFEEQTLVRELLNPVPFGHVVDAKMGDVDGDGDLDLMASQVRAFQFRATNAFLQVEPGVFEEQALAIGPLTQGPASLAALLEDFDGDGHLDRAAPRAGDEVELNLMGKPLGFDPVGEPFLPSEDFFTLFASADFDGDGDSDLLIRPLVISFPDGSNYGIYRNLGAGLYDPIQIELGNEFTPVVPGLGDLDGDARLDIAWGNPSPTLFGDPGAIFANIQQADGSFGAEQVLFPTPYCPSVRILDLDGDGTSEMLANPEDVWGVYDFLPDGSFGLVNGSASVLTPTVSPAGTGGPVVGDLDGDGDQDIVTPQGEGATQLSVHMQLAPLTFGESQQLLDGGSTPFAEAFRPQLADLDRDGALDLVVGDALSASAIVFYQDEPGTFGAQPQFVTLGKTPFPNTPEVRAVDWDQDGDLDLGAPEGLIIGEPIFGAEQLAPRVYAPITYPYAFLSFFGDFDEDGDLDHLDRFVDLKTMRVHYGAH